MKKRAPVLILSIMLLLFAGLSVSYAAGPDEAADYTWPSYTGPNKRIAVTRFDNKV